MTYKVLPILFLFLCVFINSSCKHKRNNFDTNENCIESLRFVSSSTPNPDKIVFTISIDDNLKGLLLAGNWDSINYAGGIFDTINYNDRKISPVQTTNSHKLLIGLPAYKFFKYSQKQMDSIATITFEKVEIDIFSRNKIWKLKPCDKSGIK